MKKKAVLIILLLLGVSSGVATSQTRTPGIDQRERNQQARIREGVRTGQLTRGETRRLAAEQRRIKAHEAMTKADGRVTSAERRHLKRELRRSNRHIHHLKHNRLQRRA